MQFVGPAWWIQLKNDPFIHSRPFQGHIESPKHGPHVGFFCSDLKGHDSLMDTAESDPFVRSGPFQGHIESPKHGPCVVCFFCSRLKDTTALPGLAGV